MVDIVSVKNEAVGTAGWTDGKLPRNVRIGANTVITGPDAFKRFRTQQDPGLVIGANCTMDLTHFSFQPGGQVSIGDGCVFASVVLLCEERITIGNHVAIGWNTYVMDADFHPMEPAQRLADAFACSQLGAAAGLERPPVPTRPVVIDDDVWIGPGCMVFKGVHIGAGSFIEPGSVLTTDVPPRSRVLGNPARIIGQV
jgi:acetyltransferase-like isoleucine patch superfamily enzyme